MCLKGGDGGEDGGSLSEKQTSAIAKAKDSNANIFRKYSFREAGG
jgi:hypothetical protein